MPVPFQLLLSIQKGRDFYKNKSRINQKHPTRGNQKHPSRGVLKKMYSKNMQRTYRRVPMSKRDFNKVVATLLKSLFGMGVPL